MMLFVAMAEVPLMLISLVIVKIARNCRQYLGVRHAKAVTKERACELSEAQKIMIVNAILESSLLINDSAADALFSEGETLYPAEEACKLKNARDFDLQYGTESWLSAWNHALGDFFDCRSEYIGDGAFHVYGKEV